MEGWKPADRNEEHRSFHSHGPLAGHKLTMVVGGHWEENPTGSPSPWGEGTKSQEGQVNYHHTS